MGRAATTKNQSHKGDTAAPQEQRRPILRLPYNWDCPNLLWELMVARRVKHEVSRYLSRVGHFPNHDLQKKTLIRVDP
jgi:hypothetical protein